MQYMKTYRYTTRLRHHRYHRHSQHLLHRQSPSNLGHVTNNLRDNIENLIFHIHNMCDLTSEIAYSRHFSLSPVASKI